MSEPNAMKNLVVWTDIPVTDLDRAAAFYAGVLARKVTREAYNGVPFAVVEHTEGSGACLVVKPRETSPFGLLVYFNVDGRIQEALARTESLGGKVVQGLHPIGPHGFRAIIEDSEGNRLALHSTVDA